MELPAELDYPSLYRAAAAGTMSWTDEGGGEARLDGRLRASFVVYPDGRVLATHLTAWIEDADLEVTFLGWVVERETLRCTTISNAVPLVATLEGDRITIPSGAELVGRTLAARGPNSECRGSGRVLELETTDEAIVVHDPQANHFALQATFDSTVSDSGVSFSLAFEGGYLNRPPVAVLETAPGSEAPFTEGCPDTGKGKPPVALANGPDGLTLTLRSASFDPDGLGGEEVGLKRPRLDIRQERWLYSDGGAFRYLGDGPSLGELVFATGREHRLLLVAVDRAGAQGSAFCHFEVVEEAS